MKKSKQAYYDKYFEKNWNNIKNTWKGIKSLISLKTLALSVPTDCPLIMVIPIPTILLTRLIVTLPLELKQQKKA